MRSDIDSHAFEKKKREKKKNGVVWCIRKCPSALIFVLYNT